MTNYEIELLKKSSAEIASKIPEGAMVVELGSGSVPVMSLLLSYSSEESVYADVFAVEQRNLRKICLLLQAFEDAKKRIDYFALDLSQTELERTLAEVPAFDFVTCRGLLGTYDDGREWLKQEALLDRPKCIVHLGSSIGMTINVSCCGLLATVSSGSIPLIDACLRQL